MRSVCIMANKHGHSVDKQIKRMIGLLADKDIHPYCMPEDDALFGLDGFSPDIHKADFAVVLGGDGTLLHAARFFSGLNIPVLGVNLGTLGFLSEILPEDMEMALERILLGQYRIERRIMLHGALQKNNVSSGEILALNEIGLFRDIEGGVVRIAVYSDGVFVGIYSCDGMMVSTPTGSTAYSLSAGGPIVEPSVHCLLLVPVCAHSLYARPIVLPENAKVELVVYGNRDSCKVLADDQKHASDVRQNEKLLVRRASHDAQFIRLNQWNYFEQLRKKLAEWNTPQWEDHRE